MTTEALPATGTYRSPDDRVRFDWTMPDYSDLDRKLCGLGLHIASRERVVSGWVSYFTKVDHYYCACGSRRWLRYERSFMPVEETAVGGHVDWIAMHLRMEEEFARFEKVTA